MACASLPLTADAMGPVNLEEALWIMNEEEVQRLLIGSNGLGTTRRWNETRDKWSVNNSYMAIAWGPVYLTSGQTLAFENNFRDECTSVVSTRVTLKVGTQKVRTRHVVATDTQIAIFEDIDWSRVDDSKVQVSIVSFDMVQNPTGFHREISLGSMTPPSQVIFEVWSNETNQTKHLTVRLLLTIIFVKTPMIAAPTTGLTKPISIMKYRQYTPVQN